MSTKQVIISKYNSEMPIISWYTNLNGANIQTTNPLFDLGYEQVNITKHESTSFTPS